ncbi:F-box/LRR-repeat protein 4 [Magnolia sinica]|uniref:F-box/LRR-repeat protein 4 n=1 Tax=Magnolia sinica TaxID=86752 RepID=UPI002658C5A5|nr:F-box/LRR-repeat protein 4 [Magnolia sinica]
MARTENGDEIALCINDILTDDELRAILSKLESEKEKDGFALVCKRWLHLQSTERKKLCARAGPLMLRRLASRFSRLLELDLSQSASRSFYPGVTDSDLSVIAAGFRCLRTLNLQNCKGVTDSGMMALGNSLPSLQALDVSNCRKLTDKGLVAVTKGCCNLKSLQLVGCKSVTDGLLEALSKNCCHLEELGLHGCVNITNSGLSSLVDGCCRIKFLDVNKCSKIGDIGVSRVASSCSSSLRTLKLLDCFEVGDESILSLADSCKDLETLVIGGCRYVSDESIKALALACNHSLRNLRLDWCSNISDSSVSCILSNCRNLEVLDIACCNEITDMAFRGLERGGSEAHLKVLKASNCPKITVSGIGVLLEFCKSLEHLDVTSCPHVTKAGCEQAGLQFPECCKVNFTGSLLGRYALDDGFL